MTESLIKKARDKGLLNINLVDIRDFTADKHKTADDTPYGGGPGMVMKPEPLTKAIKKVMGPRSKVILLCPTGTTLDQEKAKALANEEHLILICGHYEGIDERIRNKYVQEEISIGDYVLTGGEIPAMVIIDCISRLIPGVVKEDESVRRDSFYEGLLDYPSYTRPEEFEGEKVPEVLLSGNHKEIEDWRRKESLKKTLEKRPDLLVKAKLSEKDRKFIEDMRRNG